jgi:hypothetical protein
MNSRQDHNTNYQSYMLRMWGKRDGNGKQVWTASLEEPGSHHIMSFEDPNALFAFLLSKLGIVEPGEGEDEQ